MAPERPRPAGSGPVRLTASEIGWLRQLAITVRAAPTDRDRIDAVTIVVRKARAHRATGVRWSDIATALGVTDATLRRWRRADDAKPTSVPRAAAPTPHTRLPDASEPPVAPDRSAGQTRSAHVSQSQSQHILSTESAYSRWTGRPTAASTQPGSHARRVLVVTGDPRPGGNLFGPEAAVIRDRLSSAYVDIRERACIELGELSRELDQLHPSVLHLAAHSAFGGLVLSLDGVAWSVGYDAFAAMIERSFRPRLVVLNLCDSHALSHVLRGLVEALITWPGQTDDGRCRTFAGQLYKALALGTPSPRRTPTPVPLSKGYRMLRCSPGPATAQSCSDADNVPWPDLPNASTPQPRRVTHAVAGTRRAICRYRFADGERGE